MKNKANKKNWTKPQLKKLNIDQTKSNTMTTFGKIEASATGGGTVYKVGS